MPRDGLGNFTRATSNSSGDSAWQDQTSIDDHIYALEHDIHDQDMADAIGGSLSADGSKESTADQPMGGHKHTNVGNASARTHYASAGQVADSSLLFAGTTTGSSTAYAASLSPAITAYANGMIINFIPHVDCGNNATININGVGDRFINHINGSVGLSAGDISASRMVTIVYSSASGVFYLISPCNKAKATTLSVSGNAAIGGTLEVTGTSSFTGAVTANSITGTTMSVTPSTSFSVSTATATITGSSAATLTSSGTAKVNGATLSFSISGSERATITDQSGVYTFTPASDNTWNFGTSAKALRTVYAYGVSADSGTAANLTLAGGSGYGIAFCLNGNITPRMQLNDSGGTYNFNLITDNKWVFGSSSYAAQTIYTYGVSAKSGTAANLTLQGGTGYGINFCPNGSATAQMALGSTGRLALSPSTAYGTSSKNPANDAPNGWFEMLHNGVTVYVPHYAA